MASAAARQPDADVIAQTARQTALNLAVDDTYGLWELLWGLHTDFPQAPPPHLQSIACRVLADLIREGLIALVSGRAGGKEEPLPAAQALNALDQLASWAEPQRLGDAETRFVATEAGRHAYFVEARPVKS